MKQTKVKFDFMISSAPIVWDALPLRRVPTQARSREKVARAIAAAEAIALDEGAEAINLTRVAAASGVSVGALYQYLPDRDAIVAVLMARYHERLERSLEVATDALRDLPRGVDAIDGVLDAVAEIYRDEAAGRALRTAITTPELAAARAAHKERMSAHVTELLRRAGVAPSGVDIEVAAAVAFAAADGVLHQAFDAEPALREQMLAELRRLLRIYLTAP